MTKKMRRTRITIEHHEVTIIRQRGKRISVYCENCRSTVTAYTAEEIAQKFQIQPTEIGKLTSAGEIHFIETSAGNLPLVCGGRSNQ